MVDLDTLVAAARDDAGRTTLAKIALLRQEIPNSGNSRVSGILATWRDDEHRKGKRIPPDKQKLVFSYLVRILQNRNLGLVCSSTLICEVFREQTKPDNQIQPWRFLSTPYRVYYSLVTFKGLSWGVASHSYTPEIASELMETWPKCIPTTWLHRTLSIHCLFTVVRALEFRHKNYQKVAKAILADDLSMRFLEDGVNYASTLKKGK